MPLYEAKIIWNYDHRFGSYHEGPADGNTHPPTPTPDQYANPCSVARPRYWAPANEVEERVGDWDRGWLLGFRNVTNATNERTMVTSVLPRSGVGHSIPLVIPLSKPQATKALLLLGDLASLPSDYASRRKSLA